MDVVFLLASFAVILAGALLFTNAIEWAGHRLGLGEGATGSVLAAVGTAMPETLIPIVAIIGGGEGSEDVAVGAIIGAPFLLATIAMALVGISALIFRGRREQGARLAADIPTLDRDLVFFLVFFALGIAARAGAAGRRWGSRSRSSSCSPTASTCARPCAAGERCRRSSRSAPLYVDRSPGDEPPDRRDRPAAGDRPRRDRRRRPPVRRGAVTVAARRRDRAARALARAGAAGDRAAREGEQLLLGHATARTASRSATSPARWSSSRRSRSRSGSRSPSGTSTSSRSSRASSGSPAARSPTGRCGCAGGSSALPIVVWAALFARLHRLRRARLSEQRRAASEPGRRASSATPSGSRARSCPHRR